MSQMKYFVKLNGVNDSNKAYEIITASISSTEDMLKNIPLINHLFRFPENSLVLNEYYYNKLSIFQYCFNGRSYFNSDSSSDCDRCGNYDTCDCYGMTRSDFIEYYTGHPTLLEELQSNEFEDPENAEIYVFNSQEEVKQWLLDLKWIDEDQYKMPETVSYLPQQEIAV